MTGRLTFLLLGLAATAGARADEPIDVEKYMVEGKLAEGQEALKKHLAATPGDDRARFGLGMIQFVRAVESRMQSFHRYGFRADAGFGITNLPIVPNPKPEPLDYAGSRALFQSWIDDLNAAEQTLAQVRDPAVKLPIHLGRVRLDFDGDGKSGDEETLGKVYGRFTGRPRGRQDTEEAKKAQLDEDARNEALVVAFDRSDVDWLRGYCHLLMAFAEGILSADGRELFDHCGHVFFAGAKTPFPFLKRADPKEDQFNFGQIADLITVIHLLNKPPAEPRRLAEVLRHLEAVTTLSRSMWTLTLAESDDDHEWIPNPAQKQHAPNAEVTDAIVRGWLEFLDEFDAILAGKTLLPFWRGGDTRGVNLRLFLLEPGRLDLVLWIQGTAAEPYLEVGPVTDPAFWQRLGRVFRGEFIGFAIWFN